MNQEIWSRCGMKVGFRASFKIDEFVKSRQETMFVTYHEGHEEHEAEIIKYFLTLRVLRALRGENRTFYGFIIIKITIELLADHKPDALQSGLIKSDRIHSLKTFIFKLKTNGSIRLASGDKRIQPDLMPPLPI